MKKKINEVWTQKDEVFFYMKENGSISTLECAKKLYIVDLQAVIRCLKKEVAISYKWEHKKNRYGRLVCFKRYRLSDKDDQKLGFTRYWDC